MVSNTLKILGIDPGLETTGISILEVEGSTLSPLYCQCIKTKKKQSLDLRLKSIYESVVNTIEQYNPACLAIEQIFFSVNAKSAIKVGQARGVCILAASINGLPTYEYTPLEVKQAIVGYGRATKQQIKYMLKNILNVSEQYFPKKDDAWDAMAVCVCHGNSYRFKQKIKESGP